MTTTTTLIGAATLLSLATFSNLEATTIDLPLYGFQIESLDAKVDSPPPAKALIMFLPESDGFQPNINVLIQPYNGTINDYIAVTKEQFEQIQCKVISEHLKGENGWIVEYSVGGGHDLHCYGQAVSKSSKIYLVTATAKESQWATVGDTLRKRVDSFKTE
jgi:hypothetical protein